MKKNKYKKYINKIKTIVIFLIVLILSISIIVYSKSSSKGAKDGLYFCANILIPSLFPFMFLSAFVVKSGICVKLACFMEPLTNLLFKLPGVCGATLLISLIGGYPTGARGIKALFEEGLITKTQAEKMSYFSIGAGPCFIISVVGANLLKSLKAGIILFVSQIIASLIIAVIVGNLSTKKSKRKYNRTYKTNNINISNAVVDSCTDSINGMINMCAFVILFSCFINIINACNLSSLLIKILLHLGFNSNIANVILPVLLEVTNGCINAAKSNFAFEVTAFAIGWAGICVHFQIFSSLREIPFSKLKFEIIRFLNGILAAVITHVGFRIFPVAVNTFLDTNTGLHYSIYSNYLALIFLFISCISLLISLSFERIDFCSKKC